MLHFLYSPSLAGVYSLGSRGCAAFTWDMFFRAAHTLMIFHDFPQQVQHSSFGSSRAPLVEPCCDLQQSECVGCVHLQSGRAALASADNRQRPRERNLLKFEFKQLSVL